jgi:3-dehydroquinate dehydratase/shikimate dehydrogenase
MEGHETADPLEMYSFTGKEAVMDLIYMPEKTLFLERAASAGCKILNGYDMVIRQACLQYEIFTGKEFPQKLLSRINYPSTQINH